MGAQDPAEEFGRHFVVLLVGGTGPHRQGALPQFVDEGHEGLLPGRRSALRFPPDPPPTDLTDSRPDEDVGRESLLGGFDEKG